MQMRRVGRTARRVRAWAAAATVFLVLATFGNAATAGGAGISKAGGSIVWAIETEPVTLNPQQFTQAKARLLYYNQFDSLLTRDDQGDFRPWLATSYRISADGLTYTLTLRHGVTFHDGERFDAAAVKANFDKLLTPGYVTGATAGQLKNLRSVDVVDRYTVRANMLRPDILILDFFASPRAAQISPKSLANPDLKSGGVDVVGTGPFILDRYVKGRELHYIRNAAYRWPPSTAHHRGPAFLREVTYRFIKDSPSRVEALTSGQAEVIEGVPADAQARLMADPRLRFSRQLNAGTAYSYYFNVSHAPFDDVRVRKAFRDAVDVDAVLDEVHHGVATRAWSIAGPTNSYYDPSLEKTYGKDPAEANRLLDEAGWGQRDSEGFRVKDGRRLTVRLVQSAPLVRDNRDALALAVKAAVKQSAGIDLQVRVADLAGANEALAKNEYEVYDNSRGDTDIGVALNLIIASDALPGGSAATNNWARYSDADVDAWLRGAQATADTTRRREYYLKVQQKVVSQDAVLLPLYAPADQIASVREVQGLGFEPVAGVPASAYDVWVRRPHR
jgi:peptide/nickel transport system substrate-binding protein